MQITKDGERGQERNRQIYKRHSQTHASGHRRDESSRKRQEERETGRQKETRTRDKEIEGEQVQDGQSKESVRKRQLKQSDGGGMGTEPRWQEGDGRDRIRRVCRSGGSLALMK